MIKEICPLCDSSDVQAVAKIASFLKGDAELTYERVSFVCTSCGADYMSDEQTTQNRRGIVAAEGKLATKPAPKDIKAWRSIWKMTQAQAGKLLQVGPTAFSKYENSVLLPSGPTSQFIKLLISHPESTKALAEMEGIQLSNELDSAALISMDSLVIRERPLAQDEEEGIEHLEWHYNKTVSAKFEISGVPCVILKNSVHQVIQSTEPHFAVSDVYATQTSEV